MSLESKSKRALEQARDVLTQKELVEMERAEKKLNSSLNRVLALPKGIQHEWKLVPYVRNKGIDWKSMSTGSGNQIALTVYEGLIVGVIRTVEYASFFHPRVESLFYVFENDPMPLDEDEVEQSFYSTKRMQFIKKTNAQGFSSLAGLGLILESRNK